MFFSTPSDAVTTYILATTRPANCVTAVPFLSPNANDAASKTVDYKTKIYSDEG